MGKAALTSALLGALVLLTACGSSAKSPAADDTTTTNALPASDAHFSQLLNGVAQHPFKLTFTDALGDTQVFAQDGKGRHRHDRRQLAGVHHADGGDHVQPRTDQGRSPARRRPPISARTAATSPTRSRSAPTPLRLAYHLAHTSAKTIAGHDAACFSISAPDFHGVKGVAGARRGASLKGIAAYCNDRATGAAAREHLHRRVRRHDPQPDGDEDRAAGGDGLPAARDADHRHRARRARDRARRRRRSVTDVPEAQAASWRELTGGLPVAAAQHAHDVARSLLARPDLHERAHDGAHHLPQNAFAWIS